MLLGFVLYLVKYFNGLAATIPAFVFVFDFFFLVILKVFINDPSQMGLGMTNYWVVKWAW